MITAAAFYQFKQNEGYQDEDSSCEFVRYSSDKADGDVFKNWTFWIGTVSSVRQDVTAAGVSFQLCSAESCSATLHSLLGLDGEFLLEVVKQVCRVRHRFLA